MCQGKETSLELRNLIVKLKGEKKSYSEIAKILKTPRSTVQTIYRNYVMRGNVLNKSQCGRPHKLSDRDARAIVRKVKKNPKICAPKLADQIATASGKKVKVILNTSQVTLHTLSFSSLQNSPTLRVGSSELGKTSALF
ncbi:hypothetical protein TNCT_451411 [Trichonephila clavata]|uniref:Sleeping Beauty transposase HTH domain-containing protein n=1 Tax=Trichonephila clavata TaxID=2740835 RepID=A0A8X6KYV1_TRICU|nr:hypothetical protein TNCT_451411 [Trichonephila clavata]